MKRGSTTILKLTVATLGLAVLAICAFVLPQGIMTDQTGGYRYILAGLYVPALPFFYALYLTLQLLGQIEKNKVFSDKAVILLRRIKYCAYAISGMFAAGMPYIFTVADRDDAPGVVAIGLIIIAASFVIAMAAAVFQQLLQHAVKIKSENDLTV